MLEKLGTLIGTLAPQDKKNGKPYDALERKNESRHAFATLARKPRWHIDQLGTQGGMARDLASSGCSNFIDVYLLLELFFVQL